MNRFLIIFLLLLLPLGLWGCERSGDISRPENIAPWKDSDSKGTGSVSEEGQLMGFAESQEDAEALGEELSALYPDCDVEVHMGGQPLYYYLLSVE